MTRRPRYKKTTFEKACNNPISAIDAIGKKLRVKSSGYQAMLRDQLGLLLGTVVPIKGDIDLYHDLIGHECFNRRKRFHTVDKNNFKNYVCECVVRRAFHGSGISGSCISKYIRVVSFCDAQGVKPDEAAAYIKNLGGVDDTYKLARQSSTKEDRDDADGDAQQKIQDDTQLHIDLKNSIRKRIVKSRRGTRFAVLLECGGRDDEGYRKVELMDVVDWDESEGTNDDEEVDNAA